MFKYIVLVFVFLAAFLFLWWNREHPKAQEAIIAAALVFMGAIAFLFFSGEAQPITKSISTVYFISTKENKPIFFDAPILTHFYLQQNIIYGNFAKANEGKPVSANIIDDHRLFCDLQSIAVLNHLYQNYPHSWFAKRVSEKFPGFTTVKGENLGDTKKDIVIYKKSDLAKAFSENKFFNCTYGIEQLAFPKGTIVKYEPYTDQHKYCLIEFRKPFYFDTKIRIGFSSYVVGLGSVAKFTSVSEDWYDKSYGTMIITMNCESVFNKAISGNPLILKYKKWLGNLFEDFYNAFDWQVCNSNMKEYMETTAHQAIIDKLK